LLNWGGSWTQVLQNAFRIHVTPLQLSGL
jgi:hypothetical protein